MTSGPRQPQCLWSVNASTPWTSRAGFDRVNVSQRKFSSVPAAKSASSTITTSGNARSGWSGPIAAQNRSMSAPHGAAAASDQIASSPSASSRGRGSIRGPETATTPGRQTRGPLKPAGRLEPAGSETGNSRIAGPRAATTSFEPALKPVPE